MFCYHQNNRDNGLWANNLPLFDDGKTYVVITNILGRVFK